MKIATGVITAPGRVFPTVDKTVDSLENAGFDDISVYVDEEQSGCWVNWINALTDLVGKDAEAIMICEDDVAFSPGLRGYLEASLWPERPEKIALCSPFCPELYRVGTGWHLENRGWNLCMAQCWILPKSTAERVHDRFKDVPAEVKKIPKITPDNIASYGRAVQERLLTDSRIGKWAREESLNVWYHTPSLAQHTAINNSLIGNDFGMDTLREANDFDPDASYRQIMLNVIAGLLD